MESFQPSEKRQRISYQSYLPSRELNILLVGPSDLCEPLASALLQVQLDQSQSQPSIEDKAIVALKRTCFLDVSMKRNVHMAEKWSEIPQKIRLDHVVVLVSPSNVEESLRRLKQGASVLDECYVTLQRLSVVLVLEPVHGYRDAEPIMSRLRNKKRRNDSSLFAAPVPCFPCQLREHNSHLAVSRMVLQRAKLGTRQGSSSVVPCVSPLVFASYS